MHDEKALIRNEERSEEEKTNYISYVPRHLGPPDTTDCVSQMIKNGDICEFCPQNKWSDPQYDDNYYGSSRCWSCPEGWFRPKTFRMDEISECLKCPDGYSSTSEQPYCTSDNNHVLNGVDALYKVCQQNSLTFEQMTPKPWPHDNDEWDEDWNEKQTRPCGLTEWTWLFDNGKCAYPPFGQNHDVNIWNTWAQKCHFEHEEYNSNPLCYTTDSPPYDDNSVEWSRWANICPEKAHHVRLEQCTSEGVPWGADETEWLQWGVGCPELYRDIQNMNDEVISYACEVSAIPSIGSTNDAWERWKTKCPTEYEQRKQNCFDWTWEEITLNSDQRRWTRFHNECGGAPEVTDTHDWWRLGGGGNPTPSPPPPPTPWWQIWR